MQKAVLPSVLLAAAVALLVTGCSSNRITGLQPAASEAPSTVTATTPAESPAPTVTTEAAPAEAAVARTVVRFASDAGHVDVTVDQDSPAARDFVSMLPLELQIDEFAGSEKIAYLPRALAVDGTAGSDPEDGDLIYYVPWGNVAFYYDATGVGYSDQTLHLGTYTATLEQLASIEGPVAVSVLAED